MLIDQTKIQAVKKLIMLFCLKRNKRYSAKNLENCSHRP